MKLLLLPNKLENDKVLFQLSTTKNLKSISLFETCKLYRCSFIDVYKRSLLDHQWSMVFFSIDCIVLLPSPNSAPYKTVPILLSFHSSLKFPLHHLPSRMTLPGFPFISLQASLPFLLLSSNNNFPFIPYQASLPFLFSGHRITTTSLIIYIYIYINSQVSVWH